MIILQKIEACYVTSIILYNGNVKLIEVLLPEELKMAPPFTEIGK